MPQPERFFGAAGHRDILGSGDSQQSQSVVDAR